MKTYLRKTGVLMLIITAVLNMDAQEKTNENYNGMENIIVGEMEYVIFQHEVTNFETWKTIYEADEAVRKEEGMREMLLLRGSNNPNKLTIIFEYTSKGKVIEFISNPDLGEKMKKAGVKGQPVITFFKTDKSGIPVHNAFMMIKHKVQDYPVWKKGFDEGEKSRQGYHINLVALGNDVNEKGYAVVLLNSKYIENFRLFKENSGLKEKMQKFGVISDPDIDIMTRYR